MVAASIHVYDRSSANCIKLAREEGIEGARALLETFYYAFNNRDMDVFANVWAHDENIQLNNPLGGILRGYVSIAALYGTIFNGPANVWVEFSDIVEFESKEMVVFAGREKGEFYFGNEVLPLSVRSSRVVRWFGPETGWRQIHYHGSIDDSELLANYQVAILGGDSRDDFGASS